LLCIPTCIFSTFVSIFHFSEDFFSFFFFFFQAEDGIRDRNVTGVQTCALPISHHRVSRKGIFLPFHAAQRSARQPFLPAARGERLPRRADSRTRRLGTGESHRESGVARWPRREPRGGLPPALRAARQGVCDSELGKPR